MEWMISLVELKVLVERARSPVTVKFVLIGCDLDDMVVIGVSDASFAGMPRGRSPGGMVLAFANPGVLEGPDRLTVTTYHQASGQVQLAAETSGSTLHQSVLGGDDICRLHREGMDDYGGPMEGHLGPDGI